MIWFLSPHWKTDWWYRIQVMRISALENSWKRFRFLATGTPEMVSVFGDVWHHEPEFTLNGKGFPNHWLKLDWLFSKALEEGAVDKDIVIFLDGDAFPIGEDFRPRILSALAHRKYVFIKEEAEHKPSCMFFACRVKDWRGMSWCPGFFDMLGPDGSVVKKEFDVGGPLAPLIDDELSHILERTSGWKHPDFFATWGDRKGPLVYHHGAGFRRMMVSRAERAVNVNGKKRNEINRKISEEAKAILEKGENLW